MRVRTTVGLAGAMLLAGMLGACGDFGRSTAQSPSSEISTGLVETSSVIVRMTGTGQIGDGQPLGDGFNVQAFDLDAGVQLGQASGRLDYVDSTVVKPDGNYAHLRAGPDEPGTAVTGFVQISATCVDVSGVGRLLNTGELLDFLIQVCDNGTPGVGRDIFGISVYERILTHGMSYHRGSDMLSDGELTRTTSI